VKTKTKSSLQNKILHNIQKNSPQAAWNVSIFQTTVNMPSFVSSIFVHMFFMIFFYAIFIWHDQITLWTISFWG
jgi:hypothetical protein